jgi:hypothetical protein
VPAPYYVSVRGGPSGEFPNKPHATLEAATAEAHRLHQLLKGAFLVRVMETTLDIDPTTVRLMNGRIQSRTIYHPIRNPDGERWRDINAAKKLAKQTGPVVTVKRKKALEVQTEGGI